MSSESAVRDEMLGRVVLGRYRIVRRLARGGMGIVYLARSEGAAGFAQPVVVKRILPDLTGDVAMTKMFAREARILSRLNHPNIVSVVDFAEDADAYVMVIEYVHGYHLGHWAKYFRKRDQPFPAVLALHVLSKVLDALQHAHTLQRPDGSAYEIVHRDVSPANIHLSVEGRVKLLDFGIAKVNRGAGEYQTEEVALKGKLPYLAPELFKTGIPSPRSDLYACGVVLHELLIGQNEFRGEGMSDTIARVLHRELSSLQYLRPDVDARIDAVVTRALAKDPEARYASAGEFAEDLRMLRGVPETEAERMLAERVAEDFSPAMAETLQLVPLSEFDEAWRNPPDNLEPYTAERGEPTTATEIDMPRPASRRSWWVLGIAVLAMAGAGFAWWQRARYVPPSPPPMTVVALGEDGLARDPAGAEIPPKGQTEDPAPEAQAVSARVEQAVSPHLPRFARCKSRVQPDGRESRFTLFFEIGTGGKVESVHVSPQKVGASKLGRCYRDVATKVQFPSALEGVTSSLPITLR